MKGHVGAFQLCTCSEWLGLKDPHFLIPLITSRGNFICWGGKTCAISIEIEKIGAGIMTKGSARRTRTNYGPFTGWLSKDLSAHALSEEQKTWLGGQVNQFKGRAKELHVWSKVPIKRLNQYALQLRMGHILHGGPGRPSIIDDIGIKMVKDSVRRLQR